MRARVCVCVCLSVCLSVCVTVAERRAQEWHIVSLLGDVTSPTTAVDYVSMTSDLRVLSTEEYCPVRRQHTVYTNKSLQCKGEVRSSPLNK